MEKIFQTLSVFNNVTLTKSQWTIIMTAAGINLNNMLWKAFCNIVLEKNKWNFTLRGLSMETLKDVYAEYTSIMRGYSQKSYNKKKENVRKEQEAKAKEEARKRAEAMRMKIVLKRNYVFNPDGTVAPIEEYDPTAWRD